MKRYLGVILLLSGFVLTANAQSLGQPFPQSLQTNATQTENLIDALMAHKWDRAETLLDSIRLGADSVLVAMQVNQMSNSAMMEYSYFLFRLKALVHDKSDPVMAALVANQVTALFIDLEQYYAFSSAVQVSRMDYLTRDIVLLAQLPDDYGLIQTRLLQLDDNWQIVKGMALQKNGGKLVKLTDGIMNDLENENPSKLRMVKDGDELLGLIKDLDALIQY